MDKTTILTLIGTAITTIAFVYAFMRNFKTDVNEHIDRIDKRLDDHMKKSDIENVKRDNLIMKTNARMDGVYNVILKNMNMKSE